MVILKAKKREIKGKKVNILRKENMIPAVVYGHNLPNQSLTLNYSEFIRVFNEAGESSLIDLKMDEQEPVSVLIQDIQFDPISDKIQHVDFHQVRKGEKIHTEIELKFVGESKAVKELGGILVKTLDKIGVECLPKDLVREIEVDISLLNTFEDLIRIKDLKMPAGIEILENLNETIISVAPPREEEVKEEVVKEEEKVAEVKVGKEEKKVEEEKEKEE